MRKETRLVFFFSTRNFFSRLYLLLGVLVFWLASACGIERQAGEACYGSYECKPGLFCSQGKCIDPGGQSCISNRDCPSQFRCRFKLCVSLSSLRACSLSNPCPEDMICRDGFCSADGEGRPCKLDRDCKLGLICDHRGYSVCRPGQRCTVSQDCDPEFVCEEKRCVRKRETIDCVDTTDCPEGRFCNQDGQCELP